MALDFSKPLHLPLAAGVDLQTHEYALEHPSLRVCQNARFNKPGSLTKRWGHSYLTESDPYNLSDPEITSGSATGTSNPATASITGLTAAGDLVLLFILQEDAAPDLASSIQAFSAGPPHPIFGLVTTVTFTGRRLSVYWSQLPDAIVGTIGISFPSVQDVVIWSVHHYAGGRLGGSATSTGSGTAASASIGFHNPSSLVAMAIGSSIASGSWTADSPSTSLDTTNANNTSQLFSQFSNAFDESPSATRGTPVSVWGTLAVEVMPPIKGMAVSGGGELVSIRGLATRRFGSMEELLAFASNLNETDVTAGTRIFSWSPTLELWFDRGAFEGADVQSRIIADNPLDQKFGDRARYTNADGRSVEMHTWAQPTTAVWYEIVDADTGTVLHKTTVAGSPQRPRCFTVGAKFHVYYTDGSDLKVKVIDPVTFAVSATTTLITSTTSGVSYGVCKGPGSTTYVAQRSSTTQYIVAKVNEAGTITTSATKTQIAGLAVPLALAYSTSPDRLLVARVNDTPEVRGDILNGSSLADVSANQPLDTGPGTVYQMTACFKLIPEGGGAFLADVYYSASDSTAGTQQRVVQCQTITSTGTPGTRASGPSGASGAIYWSIHTDLASHAFARGRHTYVVLCHRPNTNSKDALVVLPPGFARLGSYTLTRHDGLIIADMFRETGSRLEIGGVEDTTRHLPGVESLGNDAFACILVSRKLLADPGFGVPNYADRTLNDFIFDFNSDLPYRGVQFGDVIYFPNGLYYDGISLLETDFLAPPHYPFGTPTFGITGGAADSGLTDNGIYNYRAYWEFVDGSGERQRSTFSVNFQITTPAAQGGAPANDTTITLVGLYSMAQTMRNQFLASVTGEQRNAMSLVLFRTEAGLDKYYRVTSPDPSSSTPNNYLGNDPGSGFFPNWTDAMPDATLRSQEPDLFDSGELDGVTIGPYARLAVGQNRLVALELAVGEDLLRLSKIRTWGRGAQFSDALKVPIPQEGGEITGLAVLETALIVWKENRIYRLDGVGPSNVGQGSYGEPQLISADTGCVRGGPIVQTPKGWMFVSPKGIRVTDGVQVADIGAPVEEYAAGKTFSSAIHVEDDTVVLFLLKTNQTPLHGEDGISCLAYDYALGQWSTWTKPVGTAVNWNGTYVYTDGFGIFKRNSAKLDNEVTYKTIAEIGFLAPAGSQGRVKGRRLSVLGKHVGPHKARVRVAYDRIATWIQDKQWTVDVTKYQVRMGLTQKRFSAVKVRVEDESDGLSVLKDSFELVALSLEIGLRPFLQKQSSARSM